MFQVILHVNHSDNSLYSERYQIRQDSKTSSIKVWSCEIFSRNRVTRFPKSRYIDLPESDTTHFWRQFRNYKHDLFCFKKRENRNNTQAFLHYWWATRNLFTSFLHWSTSFVLHSWPYLSTPWRLINVRLRTVVLYFRVKIINCERKFINIKVKQVDNIWTVSNLISHNQMACVKILI